MSLAQDGIIELFLVLAGIPLVFYLQDLLVRFYQSWRRKP
jgi:hypothetical protein